MKKHIIILTALFLSLQLNAQIHLQNDSLNIPVYLVDGVEVQNLDSLKQDDIISVNVVKDKNILKFAWKFDGKSLYLQRQYDTMKRNNMYNLSNNLRYGS